MGVLQKRLQCVNPLHSFCIAVPRSRKARLGWIGTLEQIGTQAGEFDCGSSCFVAGTSNYGVLLAAGPQPIEQHLMV